MRVRHALIIGAAAITSMAAPVGAQDRATATPGTIGTLSQIYDPGRYAGSETRAEGSKTNAPTQWQTRQLIRWGTVGRCVAAQDREGSLAYVRTHRNSAQALAAARRLDPVFASCLDGAGIIASGNKAYRKAAVADALNIRLS